MAYEQYILQLFYDTIYDDTMIIWNIMNSLPTSNN